jgi:hypothetical protein
MMIRKQTAQGWSRITAHELDELVRFQLQALWDGQSCDAWLRSHKRKISELIPPVMIWGPPGVGKSSVIRDIAHDLGIGYIDVRLAQREPIDIRGLPVPTDDGVHWQISAEWPRDRDGRGIIIFDELTAADRTLQVAAYEFILDRKLGDLYTVPEGWYIVGAGNRASDRAVATTMSSALANRFLHVEIEADAQSWIKWALRHNIHPLVTGFIRFKPECLFNMDGNLERGWPSPRSWERISTVLHLAEGERTANQRMLEISIEGLVGTGAGVEFNAYRQWSGEIANVLELMLNPDKTVEIPQRADQKYAICSAMVYHLWKGRDNSRGKVLLDGFFRISLKLSSDFAAMAMIDAMHGPDPKKIDQYSKLLLEHPQYPHWQKKHGSALRKTMSAHAD